VCLLSRIRPPSKLLTGLSKPRLETSAESLGNLSAVIRLQALRSRLPFAVFVVLLIFAVLLFGFACTFMTDHPGQVIDRVLSAVAALPAIVEVWSFWVAAASALLVIAGHRTPLEAARASPPVLQRFRF
jgi:hypothetical protein